jgi:hypothetical protein
MINTIVSELGVRTTASNYLFGTATAHTAVVA